MKNSGSTKNAPSQNIRSADTKSITKQIILTQSSTISKNPENIESSRARLTSSEPINKAYNEMQNNNNALPLPSLLINTNVEKIENKVDLLDVSRYPIVNFVDITITKMQEIKLQQKLLKELKFIASLDERVLKDQHYYWLFTNNIVNEDARLRIKSALEIYCTMPMQWISGTELEIDINPEHRIEKIPNHKKKV
jgi:hypothetical protein